METTYADSWSDMAQPCDLDLWVMKWRSAWPIFHCPAILPYILKTIWCMYIILREYESVLLDVWPQYKCRSLWPIFHGPVISPYILKTVWRMNILIWDYESVWPYIWPQNKCSSLWPIHTYFMVQWFCPFIATTIWLMSVIFSDNETVWLNFDLKISWSSAFALYLEDCLIYEHPYLGLWISMTWHKMKVAVTFISWSIYFALYLEDCLMYEHQPQSKGRSLWPVFHGPVILPYIFKTIWWMCVIFSDNKTLFLKLWPQNKYRSTWLIFHGLVIFSRLFDGWTS